MIDPGQLANDIAGNVAVLGFPAVLWALLYVLAWEHAPFATSIGFGRRTFWLLLPGALLASLVLLPVAPVANDWVAISFAGALFPLLIATLAFDRFAPPGRQSVAWYLALLGAESAVLLAMVVFVTVPSDQLIALVALAAGLPLAAGAVAIAGHRVLLGRAVFVLGLTSGVLLFTFLTSVAVPGVGIEESFPAYLLPPIGAGVIAAVAAEWVFPGAEGFALPVAYASGTFGVLVGADVLRQPPLYVAGSPAGLYAIGGAGVLDLVYLSGLLALGAAYVTHRLLGRNFLPVGSPIPPAAPTPIARLGRAFRAGVEGRIDDALKEAATASRESAEQASRLLAHPRPPNDRPWQGLSVPGWVVSDQANLKSVAQLGSSDGREGFRGFLTARWLVLLGRELGLPRFGSVRSRAAAFLIDLALVTAPAAALWVFVIEVTPGSLDDLASNVGFNAAIYGYAAVAFLYFVLSERLAGRTVGKAVLGIAVRDRQMDRPGLSATLLRNVSKLPTFTVLAVGLAVALLFLLRSGAGGTLAVAGGISVASGVLEFLGVLAFVVGGVGLLGAVGVLGILLTAERQRFGDLVAGTWVVRTIRPPEAAPPAAPPAGGRSG